MSISIPCSPQADSAAHAIDPAFTYANTDHTPLSSKAKLLVSKTSRTRRQSAPSNNIKSSTVVTTTSGAVSKSERRHRCSICVSSFHRSEHLARHQLTHTGRKPFNCQGCHRGFARLDALQRHQKMHKSTQASSSPLTESADSALTNMTSGTPVSLPLSPVSNRSSSPARTLGEFTNTMHSGMSLLTLAICVADASIDTVQSHQMAAPTYSHACNTYPPDHFPAWSVLSISNLLN
ncbi:hypothetical protein BATDEDRAFT_37271 [Batrachochytrium dendrobatidis JAM81]|uniref:C2H2-type domain-containing protein n=2 Tax=Batrachochytrium dendrobatidis TaxID=109871 RepID=F4P7V9_BATDJ|nr:uncharacterized protein BATDEDRAFT_37271 [Batrachochytrium dendrobatidis JAM81]EGF78732.1 hypothetical protein BATDEDRAFT_37271 [Batrachochytrium dendrobatidis JAM81]KAJ8323933.1 hypothetical protein O5D80_007156 [Batrachochytrium dendrobatidis]KAK5664735.1 hypothetical protein QVD99_008283 [Batrachochytrium dendrobatidis]OAJ43703.1 hypothetical protein BDEG_27034 [Batrachochytrium dendrobatidis JEL423]|eukprot:XP_006680821.1 hypothetical protein BATDEDRAFT_37271 [Batrachochytrium dendrobatidis JAM81]